ncbi:hypothetical protein B7463_g11685, partial [Scytalidium lignicola]
MTLLNGTALITGTGSGIGQATAVAYAQAGCSNLSIADLNPEGLRKTTERVKECNPEVKVLEMIVDVSDPESVESMVRSTMNNFGGLQYVTSSTFDGRRAQRGSIVNMAFVCGLSVIPNIMPYIASKHAVVGVTRAFAIDYGKYNIRINAVCPGIVETPMLQRRQAMEEVSVENTKVKCSVEDPPLGRLALPEEIADICVFLSSSMSSYVHGSMVTADGGKMAMY